MSQKSDRLLCYSQTCQHCKHYHHYFVQCTSSEVSSNTAFQKVDLVVSSDVMEKMFLSIGLDYWTSDQDMNIVGDLTETGSL